MATVTVNGQDVTIGDGERLNLVQAAQRAGVEVPHYCWHPELTVVASCRMCLVEVGEKKPDGTVAMQPRVVPGCQTPAKNGTVVVTDSDKVKAAQSGTLEYILLNHPLDCPVCDQAGECYLQDYSYRFGKPKSRLDEPKTYHPDKHHIGEQIVLFTDRCVMCSRCVRFTREISGTAELQVVNRGNHAEIDILPGHPCDNKLAGNVVDICPVGALCSKDFLYKQRVWWLQSAPSVCPHCSTGCSINVDHNEDRIHRIKPRANPQAQGPFMCDDGRFGYKHAMRPERLQTPLSTVGGARAAADWEDALEDVRQGLAASAPKVAAVLSPFMTVEEAYLVAEWFDRAFPGSTLALGPVPAVGADDHYPKTVDGSPPAKVRFTIRAEKAPNRRGVEEVLKAFGTPATAAQVAGRLRKAELAGVLVVGGYPNSPWTEADAGDLAKARFSALVDILPSTLFGAATAVLPSLAWAEREGIFVNHAGLAQRITPSVRGPDGARTDGRIFWELAGRPGMYRASAVRKEMAERIPAFAALAEPVPPMGVFLGAAVPAAAGV